MFLAQRYVLLLTHSKQPHPQIGQQCSGANGVSETGSIDVEHGVQCHSSQTCWLKTTQVLM